MWTMKQLEALLKEIQAQADKHITQNGANLLSGDVQYVIEHLQ